MPWNFVLNCDDWGGAQGRSHCAWRLRGENLNSQLKRDEKHAQSRYSSNKIFIRTHVNCRYEIFNKQAIRVQDLYHISGNTRHDIVFSTNKARAIDLTWTKKEFNDLKKKKI